MKSKQDKEVVGLIIICILMAVIMVFLIFDNVLIREQYEEQIDELEVEIEDKALAVEEAAREGYHSRDWDGDDSKILAQVAMSLGPIDDLKTKMLAICVCVNRTWDDRYPDSIKENADQMTGGGYADLDPDTESLDAEKHVQYDGWDDSEGATIMVLTDSEECEEYRSEGYWERFSYGRYTFFR